MTQSEASIVRERPEQDTFWQESEESLLRHLDATANGLSSSEARTRLARYGANTLATARPMSLPAKAARRLRNPLVLVLLFAASISAYTGDFTSFFIIGSMVTLSIALDSIQEHRAELAADRLKSSVALKETVLRDGQEITLEADELVPGDVVLLAAGDLIPADGRILEARDFFVNEALLTGESYPNEKHAVPTGVESDEITDAKNAAFMGSSVISGAARLLVCRTGQATQIGEISQTLRHAPPPAALELGTHAFGLLIVRITGLLVLFVLLVNLWFERPPIESFLFAVALAVGLTPELLPMIVSVTLARGALRMAKQRVIVKRLAAIHDLGSMDVLCTDKTGTLTEAKISLSRHVALSGAVSDHVADLCWLNSHFESGLRSPLDTAILEHGPINHQNWVKVDEVPFDFERRRVSVLVEGQGKRLLVVKGAPEDILKLSSLYEDSEQGDAVALDANAFGRASALFEQLGSEGFRALGVGWREVGPDVCHIQATDERDLIFAGFAAFLDPPKDTAGSAIAALARRGVRVKILTGDNERVTRHLCSELGIPVAGVLTGGELRELNEEALSARLEQTSLFCRVTPVQKNRIILALKRGGHVVGFLGDGINDAPSLHTADVGMSVDSAVDVAKDAADIILLDHDLSVVERGVREGRRTFGNIMKYVMMATSSNFGNMFSMAGAALILPFLPMLPVQILLNNLLYDLSEVAIPLDEVDEEDLVEPRHWDMRFVRDFMLALGPVSSIFDFLTFGLLLFVLQASEALFQTGWFIESLATQTLVIFVIRTRGSPLRSRPHPLLASTSVAVVLLGILLPYTPIGAWFGLVPPPLIFLLALVGLVAAYLALAETVKRWFYNSHRRPAR